MVKTRWFPILWLAVLWPLAFGRSAAGVAARAAIGSGSRPAGTTPATRPATSAILLPRNAHRGGGQRRCDLGRRSRLAGAHGDVVDRGAADRGGSPAPERPGAAHAGRREARNAGSAAQKHHRQQGRNRQGDRADRAAEQFEAGATLSGAQK